MITSRNSKALRNGHEYNVTFMKISVRESDSQREILINEDYCKNLKYLCVYSGDYNAKSQESLRNNVHLKEQGSTGQFRVQE